jgi:hypothetical protein
MCDDVGATVDELTQKGVEFTREISDEGFGRLTRSGCRPEVRSLATSPDTPVRSHPAGKDESPQAARWYPSRCTSSSCASPKAGTRQRQAHASATDDNRSWRASSRRSRFAREAGARPVVVLPAIDSR